MPPTRPNLILVFPDQMRAQAMSCADPANGPEANVYTPNLDRIAGEGTRFLHACSSNPVCVPFRFTMMTGKRSVSRTIPAIHYRMSPAERCMGHIFHEVGYHTAYFGKWHLYNAPMGAENLRYIPPEYRGGFREWHAFELRNNHYDTRIWHGGDRESTFHEGHQTDILFDLFDDFLRGRREGAPFLGVLSVEAPHPPYQAPEAYLARQRERRFVPRPNVTAPGETPFHDPEHHLGMGFEGHLERLEEYSRAYYAMVEQIDDRMGGLMNTLEETGLADTTYVLFFADHGDLLGSHHLFGKQWPYDESINIPFLVHGPDIAAGEAPAVPVCTEDILPTVAGLAGIDPGIEPDGIDLSAFLRDPEAKPARDAVFLEHVDELRQTGVQLIRVPWRGVRTERYLFAALQEKPWLLFDMETDPYQRANVVDDPAYADVREGMIDRLIEHLERVHDPFPFSREGIAEHAPDGLEWPIPWAGQS